MSLHNYNHFVHAPVCDDYTDISLVNNEDCSKILPCDSRPVCHDDNNFWPTGDEGGGKIFYQESFLHYNFTDTFSVSQ